MSEFGPLKETLVRFVDQPTVRPNGTRSLLKDGIDPTLAMRREIEETYLPRKLSFENDRGDLIVLIVTAGRIAMLTDADNPIGSPRVLFRVNPENNDEENGKAAVLMVQKFLDGATDLFVHSEIHAADLSTRQSFLSPESFCGKIPTQEGLKFRPHFLDMRSFLFGCEEAAFSWVLVQGDEVQQFDGPANRVQKLMELAEKELTQFKRDDQLPGACTCVILNGLKRGTDAILSGRSGNDLIFMSFAAERMGKVLGEWRANLKAPP